MRLATLATSVAASASGLALPPGRIPDPIPPGCPWHELSAYGLPNVNWCEAPLCALVNEPANAWSNVAYLLVAGLVALGGRGERAPLLRYFAAAVAAVGLGSFVYHASNVHVTQILDFFGMYVFCYLLLLLNVQRLGLVAAGAVVPVFWGAVLGTTALTVLLVRNGFPIQAIVGLLTLGIVATEAVLYRRARRGPHGAYPLRWFVASFALLNAGAVSSALDVTRTWCDPQSHVLQGHVIWHVLTALSLAAAFLHYRRFDRELSQGAPSSTDRRSGPGTSSGTRARTSIPAG